MKRTIKKLAMFTLVGCLVLGIGEVSKSRAFAGPAAWVAGIDSQIGALPVYAEPSEDAVLVGSLQRCARVDMTGMAQGSWVEISQPTTGWVQSNLLSRDASLCSPRPAQTYNPEPRVTVGTSAAEPSVSVVTSAAQPSVAVAGPDVIINGFGPGPDVWPHPQWEPGHWEAGHMEGQHWIPGHWAGGHWIPGHWGGGHWVPGHWEQGHWVMAQHMAKNAAKNAKSSPLNKLAKLDPKMKPLSLQKQAKDLKTLKPLSLQKANLNQSLKLASANKKGPLTLGKINSSMSLKSGLQSSSFKDGSLKGSSVKGSFKHVGH